jgi:hypothetical protein
LTADVPRSKTCRYGSKNLEPLGDRFNVKRLIVPPLNSERRYAEQIASERAKVEHGQALGGRPQVLLRPDRDATEDSRSWAERPALRPVHGNHP